MKYFSAIVVSILLSGCGLSTMNGPELTQGVPGQGNGFWTIDKNGKPVWMVYHSTTPASQNDHSYKSLCTLCMEDQLNKINH